MRLTNQTSFLPIVREKAGPETAPEGPNAERSYRVASGPRRGTSPRPTEETAKTCSEHRTREACRKFEGFLLGEMLKTMRGGESDGKGIIPTSRGERIFIGQQCERLGDILGRSEPLGMRRLLVGSNDEARPARQDTAALVLPERGPS
ncbi:MAG: hypothetical protein ACM3VW_01110 [Bacteroidota bacterium]